MNYTLRKAKIKYEYPMVSESGKGSDGYFQRLEFNSEQLPEISNWQPGEEYTIVIKVKEVSHEIKSTDGDSKECAYFEVTEVGCMKDEEMMKMIAKKLKLK